MDLCTTGVIAEGDSLLRRALAESPADPAQPVPRGLRASLGYCLTRAKRFAEAERSLLQADSALRAIPGTPVAHRAQVVTALVGSYEAWGKPVEVEVWQARKPQ
jgi:Tfp pilus assembly protein PilF